jgi:lysophospholipase
MAEPAPLIETPDAKAPPGAEAAWIAGAGGARLRAALFTPPGRARGSVVLSGGRTEPIEKYYETIGEFLDRGFVVLAHDWRGQGLSKRDLADALKGHAHGYKAFLDDFRALLAAYRARLPRPWVAVGHSMGGALTLLALAQGEDRFAGAILSAPMLGVRTGKIGAFTARLLTRVNLLAGGARRYVMGEPGKPFADEFEGNLLTHDRVRFARTCGLVAAEPRLALGAPTWGWLDFALRTSDYLAKPERLRAITIPVIIVTAGDDRLVDNAAQAAAARQLPQGKLITIPGAFHEILMETDHMRNIFQRAFDALTGRVAPKPAEAPKPAPAAAPPPAPVAAAPAPKPITAPAPAASAPKAPAAKKPAARKSAAKKPAAKKAAGAKPAARKPAAKVAAKPAKSAKPAKPAKAAKASAPKPAKVAAKPAAKAAKAPAKKPAAKRKAAPKAAAAKRAPKTVAKAAAKPPAAKKAAPKKAAPKKAAPKKAAVKKPAVKKAAAARKPAAAKKAAPTKP